MARNIWKIISIILLILILVETSLFAYVIKSGVEQGQDQLKCSNEICGGMNAQAFVYDSNTDLCYCYNDEEVIAVRKVD